MEIKKARRGRLRVSGLRTWEYIGGITLAEARVMAKNLCHRHVCRWEYRATNAVFESVDHVAAVRVDTHNNASQRPISPLTP